MTTLLDQLRAAAVARELLPPSAEITPATAFALVRDMPYRRASNRLPSTIIHEWQGTCSGKHYLLKGLLEELDLPSTLIACTVTLDLSQAQLPDPLGEILAPVDGRFVDIHNYLIVQTPAGEMLVDATWPVAMKGLGFTVNESFELGRDQQLAYAPNETWEVADDVDPQRFKNELLAEHFTPAELAARDTFIETLSQMLSAVG